MITTIGAYILIGIFLVMEARLRLGHHAKSLEAGQYDRGSTRLIGLAFALTFLVLIVTPVFNLFKIGTLSAATLIGSLGLALMLGGIALRYWAAKTLGAFYTRTLLVQSQQQVVDEGPYRRIRHPGYLGDFVMFVGAGVAMVNWIAILTIFLVMFGVYAYRIQVEERMLQASLGDPYREYMQRTSRLIPWIY